MKRLTELELALMRERFEYAGDINELRALGKDLCRNYGELSAATDELAANAIAVCDNTKAVQEMVEKMLKVIKAKFPNIKLTLEDR